MWSKKRGRCKGCRSIRYRHQAKGLCTKCYLEKYRNNPQNKEKSKKHKSEWLKKQPKEYGKMRREQLHFGGKRELALERDNYTCQKCGEKDIPKLTVHHIDGNGRKHKTPNNKLSNLQTLCRTCHIKIHKYDLVKGRRTIKSGFWSKHHDLCKVCETTERKHYALGLCVLCYKRVVRKAKKEGLLFEDIVRTYEKS